MLPIDALACAKNGHYGCARCGRLLERRPAGGPVGASTESSVSPTNGHLGIGRGIAYVGDVLRPAECPTAPGHRPAGRGSPAHRPRVPESRDPLRSHPPLDLPPPPPTGAGRALLGDRGGASASHVSLAV